MCENLSKNHDNFVLTFHYIDDLEYKNNIKINSLINCQCCTIDMTKTKNDDINDYLDETNRYVFCMNINKINCPYGIELNTFTTENSKISLLLVDPVVVFHIKFEDRTLFKNLMVKITIE